MSPNEHYLGLKCDLIDGLVFFFFGPIFMVCVRSLKARGINNYFEKHGVLAHVSVIVQFLDGEERGAATGLAANVSFSLWPLER